MGVHTCMYCEITLIDLILWLVVLHLSQNTIIQFYISILPRDEIGCEVVNSLKLILGIRSAGKL